MNLITRLLIVAGVASLILSIYASFAGSGLPAQYDEKFIRTYSEGMGRDFQGGGTSLGK